MTRKPDTQIVTAGRRKEWGIVNPPVYHASTVLFQTVAELRHATANRNTTLYYGRRGTPTTWALQDAVAELENADGAVLYPSGVAAIAAALLAFVKTGDHVLMVDSAYEPTRAFCDRTLRGLGVETTYYDPMIGAGIAALIRPNTSVVFMESPGSLTFEVQDIPAIAAAARAAGAVTMTDNTWATPLFFKPLDHGVDISIQSATKYLVGHSDAMLGVAAARAPHFDRLREASYLLGQCAAPDDAYLAQRGLRTLGVRLARHQENGLAVANWLAQRTEVAELRHPALPGCPGHDIWKRDFNGATGLFAFRLEPTTPKAEEAFIDALSLFKIGFSWGGYESLVLPTWPAKLRTAAPWPHKSALIRLHVGLEDVADLTADLERGFAAYRAALA